MPFDPTDHHDVALYRHLQGLPTLHLPRLLGVTPFGIYCRQCNKSLGNDNRAIIGHATKHGIRMVEAERKAMRDIRKQAKDAATNTVDFAPFLTNKFRKGYECPCGILYASHQGLGEHVQKRKDPRCSFSNATRLTLQLSVCGRFVKPPTPVATVTPLATRQLSRSDELAASRRDIASYVRADEDLDTYVKFFDPMTRLPWGFVSLDSLLHQLVAWWDTPVDEEEEWDLALLLKRAEEWLFYVARADVGSIAPMWRAPLLVFEGQDRGEIAQNSVYNFRHFEHSMWPELRRLLCFVWRCPSDVLRNHRSVPPEQNQEMWAPQILFALLSEQMVMVADLPLVCIYALSRCFRVRMHRLEMVSCGHVATDVAAIMSTMRAGVCSVWHRMSVEELNRSMPMVKQSVPVSSLASIIRSFREMQRRKANQRIKSVDKDGNVAVDGFLFPRKVWSQLIVHIVAACEGLFKQLLDGDDWLAIIDVNNPILVWRESIGHLFEFKVDGDGIGSFGLSLKADYAPDALEALTSYVELCFHGCGGGSMRMEELNVLDQMHAVWHRGTIYYTAASIKQFTVKRGSNIALRQVQRKLPVVLARIYLLYRQLARKLSPECRELMVPLYARKHTAGQAMAEMFSFETKPSLLQVRHLWTSISNWVFPDGSPTHITANEESSLLSGHTAATHAGKYGSKLVGGMELMYRMTHDALGDGQFCPDDSGDLSHDDLDRALVWMFGPSARYTGSTQEKAVHAAITTQDVVLIDGCGSGKSMSWILPAIASSGNRKPFGMQIVVVPYNFLVRQHYQSASIHADKFGLDVVELYHQDVSFEMLPTMLLDEENLPDLLFVSLDSFILMMNQYGAVMANWANSNALRRIHIDEVHSLFFESFRSKYEELKLVGKFPCPVSILSGSLPSQLVPELAAYLNLSPQTMVVSGCGLFGGTGGLEGQLALSVNKVADTDRSALQSLRKHKGAYVHVICSSKKCAEGIFTHAEHIEDLDAKLVTSSVPTSEVLAIAAEWKEAKFHVLVSTTAALVGNENPKCRVVLIVGNMYSLANVVQAIGRLRPSQRIGSVVEVFLPKHLVREQIIQDRDMVQNLVDRGCLANANKAVFSAIGTCQSVHHWASQSGCRIGLLVARFGFPAIECNQCDYCIGLKQNAVANRAERATEQLTTEAQTKWKASEVLAALANKCFVCGKTSCEGDGPASCLGYGSCFVCGGKNHRRKNCPCDMKKLIMNRGCTGCLVLNGDLPHQAFHTDKRQCPLKRRFKRMLIQSWRDSGSKVQLDTFAGPILCENAKFYQFLVSEQAKKK